MTNSMSRILIETTVRNALERMKEDPERSSRNLIDMALQFSGGRFQKHFFEVAQTMLRNENSSYYELIRDVITNIDLECLTTFGMNLGYNSCTLGAKIIREKEQKLGFNIPWVISLQIVEATLQQNFCKYDELISEGNTLGIYSWILFPEQITETVLSLIKNHPNNAFFLFLKQNNMSPICIDMISELKNVMFLLPFEEDELSLYQQIRSMRLPYSIYVKYSTQNINFILNGDLFYSVQELSPLFTILLPEEYCTGQSSKNIHDYTIKIRNQQKYKTIPIELYHQILDIDQIISNDTCFAYFNSGGYLYKWNDKPTLTEQNIFHHSIRDILSKSFPKY